MGDLIQICPSSTSSLDDPVLPLDLLNTATPPECSLSSRPYQSVLPCLAIDVPCVDCFCVDEALQLLLDGFVEPPLCLHVGLDRDIRSLTRLCQVLQKSGDIDYRAFDAM